jgi:pimeloyl-ACP methyl ester carboxylesterase
MAESSQIGHEIVHYQSPDGVTLIADAWGDPGHQPVLLSHGGGQTRHAWKNTARILAAHNFYAVSMDLRGHGESGRSKDGIYKTESFLQDLEAVVNSFPTPPILVGASLGGILSLLLQGENEKDIVKAIVLVDIAFRSEKSGVKRILSFMEKYKNGFDTLEQAGDAVAAYLQHRRRPSVLNGLDNNLRRGEDGRYYWHWDPALLDGWQIDKLRHEARMLAAAKRIRVPLLLVRGIDSDVVTAEIVQEFLAILPHAQYVDVPGAGHMVAGDSNSIFTDAVLAFLEEHATSAER